MTVIAEEKGQVNYELLDRLKRRAHIRAMLWRAKNEFSKDENERVNAQPLASRRRRPSCTRAALCIGSAFTLVRSDASPFGECQGRAAPEADPIGEKRGEGG